MSKTYIYSLIDPRDGQVRYIGKTIQRLSSRLQSHLYHSYKLRTPKDRWIVELRQLGYRPKIVELARLENPTDAEVAAVEQAWIDFYRLSAALTNQGRGGQGGSRRQVIDWSPDRDALLGKQPDYVIAQLIGCDRKSVEYRRVKLGIPRCPQTRFVVPQGKPFEAIELPEHILSQLGQLPDYQLAKLAGVEKSIIRRRRIRLGIPSYAAQTGNTGKYKPGNYPTRWLKQGGDDLSHQE